MSVHRVKFWQRIVYIIVSIGFLGMGLWMAVNPDKAAVSSIGRGPGPEWLGVLVAVLTIGVGVYGLWLHLLKRDKRY